MKIQQIEVQKTDLAQIRLTTRDAAEPGDGEVLVAIDRFALTANNVTYGVVGEKIGYWQFFPVADNEAEGWGIIPVWGFAEVVRSNAPDLPVGERLYGYFPMASHLLMQPARVSNQRLFDGVSHRQALPPVYNAYRRVGAESEYDAATDNARMVLHPLYATSFCLHDYFSDNSWFGGEQVIITSASSKTSIGVAYALADDPNAPPSIGLTSPGNVAAVKGLELYDEVFAYDDYRSIANSKPTVIIDMSGSGTLLAQLHEYLGDQMRFCSNVGLTHWSDNKMQPGFIRERSEMFFAPGHIQKRAGEWGKGIFEQKAHEFWQSAAKRSQSWLKFQEVSGLADACNIFSELRDGNVSPNTGLVIKL